MNILDIVLYIAIVGFLVWLVLQIPMPAIFQRVIIGVVCFALIIWVLQSAGLIHGIGFVRLR